MTKLLVVEDNRDNMQLIDYLLKTFGYTALLATGGADGVRLARQERPDLILMDIQMPDVDGHDAAREIRSSPGLEGTPMIAVTAFAMVGDIERIMASGFDGYIAKPIAPETFVAEVEAFLAEELRVSRGATTARP